ncbi:hypothetical protein [Novosphingobium sp.]|uniref:hypothetical protein n=1 Tax=Novosphingobium sp. TaxID=1874826 RepID=UPI0025F5A50F|nr:hypothetical protein [Novosphingobium sp.]
MRFAWAVLAAALLAASPASATVFKLVQADLVNGIAKGKMPPAVTLAEEGATVTLEPTTYRGGEGEDADVYPAYRITVTLPGHAPFVVPADEARLDVQGVHVGVGRLAKSDPAPVVILEGFSGGMHCCGTFQMIAAVGDAVKVLSLDGIDGGPGDYFARDLDGDGVRDIERQDDAFRYAFASGAGSWSPPVIYNLRNGALVDVSNEPRYARVWERYAAHVLKYCKPSNRFERNGACAAYAAAMGRLGRGAEGIRIAVASAQPIAGFLPTRCRVEPGKDGGCPEGQEVEFSGFEPALRWFLDSTGYVSDSAVRGLPSPATK